MKREYREIGTGRYTYGDMDRMCICGHSLGHHNATRIRIDGVMYQDCFGDIIPYSAGNQLNNCDCKCFKPAKIEPPKETKS